MFLGRLQRRHKYCSSFRRDGVRFRGHAFDRGGEKQTRDAIQFPHRGTGDTRRAGENELGENFAIREADLLREAIGNVGRVVECDDDALAAGLGRRPSGRAGSDSGGAIRRNGCTAPS